MQNLVGMLLIVLGVVFAVLGHMLPASTQGPPAIWLLGGMLIASGIAFFMAPRRPGTGGGNRA